LDAVTQIYKIEIYESRYIYQFLCKGVQRWALRYWKYLLFCAQDYNSLFLNRTNSHQGHHFFRKRFAMYRLLAL